MAIPSLVLYGDLYGIVGVRARIILEAVRSGSSAPTIEGKNLAVFRPYCSHRLIRLRDTSRRDRRESCAAIPYGRKVGCGDPIPFGFRGTRVTIVSVSRIGRWGDDDGIRVRIRIRIRVRIRVRLDHDFPVSIE